MSPHALRALGIVSGLALGVLAGRLADALPARYGIVHLASGKKRTRRNAVLLAIMTACGAAVGELIAHAAAAAVVPAWHASLVLDADLLVTCAVVAAAAIDLEHMILPNELTIGGVLVCLASSPLRRVGLVPSVFGLVVGLLAAYVPFVLYKVLRGRSGMGLGDAKLAALAGAWFGPLGALLVLFGGSALMPLTVLLMRALGLTYRVPESVVAEIAELRARAERGDEEARAELADDPMAADVADGALSARLPLGPFLALACLVLLFADPWIERPILAWLAR